MDKYTLHYEAVLSLDGKTYCFIHKKTCIFVNCKSKPLIIKNTLNDFYKERLELNFLPFKEDRWAISIESILKQDRSDMFAYFFELKKRTLKTRIKEALVILEHYIKTGKLRIS